MLFNLNLGQLILGGAKVLLTPTTAYANAGGTGDRTGSINVTSNASPSSGTTSNLVDGATTNNSTDSVFWTIADENGLRVTFDFGAGVLKYIDEIKFYKQNLNLSGNWFYEASNDASSWVDISSVFTPGTATTVTTTCTPPDLAGYRYYSIHNRSVAPVANPWFQEFEFKIATGAT